MKTLLGGALVFAMSSMVAAQSLPSPSLDDPRLQTVTYDPGHPARLFAFPGANMTVMLLPGDQIDRVTLSDQTAFDVRLTQSNDSLNILALRPDAFATLIVDAKQRRYEFSIATTGGLAAYLVRFRNAGPSMPLATPILPINAPPAIAASISSMANQYRLSGEKTLLPKVMSDDGEHTYILWGDHQSLPAVFGLGPTGQEEVVDGYMRGGRYTIDRVYRELIFRIDKKQAKARRLTDRRPG